MEITVLVDNNTLIDRYFFAEPGLSLLIQDEETTVLFDTGYSDIFLKNAAKMGKDLSSLDYLVLSHSHLDHTWGLEPLLKYYTELEIEKRPLKRPTLVAHPDIFISVRDDLFREFGCLFSETKLAKHFPIQLNSRPLALSSRLTFLGAIPRKNDFEGTLTFGRKEGAQEDDPVSEDSALVYRSAKGLVIITGCSHAGICNIIEYAKEVCGDDRVVDIIGGFHLQNPPKRQLQGTLSYLKAQQPQTAHACHCTDLFSKIALSRVIPLKEVGVGLSIKYAV
ncbi:MAG: MBL fold metallo-hydrolase [Desulfobacteraceae bacterium]|nr:MAG: MBL fold metallo-hydrolase [Desulfobacteraceae bacterium]